MEAGTSRVWRLAVLASLAAHMGVGTLLITLSPLSANGASGPGLTMERMYLLPPLEPRLDEPAPLPEVTPAQTAERPPMPLANSTPPRAPLPQVKPPPPPPPPPPPEPMVAMLGTENGVQKATENWLASLDQGEHAGRQFEHDQPQLDRVEQNRPGGTPGSAGQDGDNGVQASPMPPPPPTPAAATPERKAQEAREKKDAVPDLKRPEGPPQNEVKIGSAGGMAPEKELPATAPKPREKVDAQEKVEATPATPAAPPMPLTAPASENVPADALTQPTPAGPAGKPGAPGAPGTPGASAKIAADRDADAASIKASAVYKRGRVETGEGLDIKTVRPEFSLTTQALRSPDSPVLRIQFSRDGRVKEVKVIKSSGYPEAVDGPVVSAVYNWRASGKLLSTLPNSPTATLSLEITIVLQ